MGPQKTSDSRLGWCGGNSDGEKGTDLRDLWEVRLTFLG